MTLECVDLRLEPEKDLALLLAGLALPDHHSYVHTFGCAWKEVASTYFANSVMRRIASISSLRNTRVDDKVANSWDRAAEFVQIILVFSISVDPVTLNKDADHGPWLFHLHISSQNPAG